MDGGWTENTFSFNSCFQVNQCLISFVFVFVFFLKAKIGILATKKKKANATTLMQRDSFGKNDPNFARFRQ